MTDRMTERYDSPDSPGTSADDLSTYGTTDYTTGGASETVTHTAAVDEQGFGGSVSGSGASTAKEHAGAVAQDAKESGKNVASTAATEAKDVAREATTQFRQLFSQLTDEAKGQASGQTQRAVQGLRSLGDELSGMAQNQQGQSGVATDLARQGADRIHGAANWLEGREPGDILEEVRSFARRRPGTFLAGAAVLGFLGGRMTRGLTADSTSGGTSSSYGTSGTSGTSTGYGYSGYSGSEAGVGTGVGTAYGATSGNGASYDTGATYDNGGTFDSGATYTEGGTAAEGYGTGATYGEGTGSVGGTYESADLGDTGSTSQFDETVDPYTNPGSSTGTSGESR